jgi:hypothetical protein
MSFLIRAFGAGPGRNSARSKDTELMAVEEGRPFTSGSLVAGAERPHAAYTYVPGQLDGDGPPIDGAVETSPTAVEEDQTNPLVNHPARAVHQPVEDHPLAQFPILKSRPTESEHKVEKESSSTLSTRRRENRNHPYLIKGRTHESVAQVTPKLKVGHKHPSSLSPFLNCSQREAQARVEAIERSEIENEVRQEMEVRRKQQEVQQGFERHLEKQVGKVIEEQKKILDEERRQFFVELKNARDATEAAIRRAEEAAEERNRMSDMLGRVEDEAAKAAQQAERNCSQREAQARVEAIERSEIENEVRQEMEVRRKQQEVQQGFERHLEKQVGKVIEEQKKILDEERRQFFVELKNARDATEAAIRRAEEAAEERNRMSDMLGRVEDEAAKAAQQAERNFNMKLNHFSLELERVRTESEAAITTGREATEAITEMTQKLEMAQSQAQWVEAEANKVAGQLSKDKAEEVRRLSEMLNAAHSRTQQAEEAAAMAAETARLEIQKAHEQAENARRQAGDTLCSGQPAPQAEVAQPIPYPNEPDNIPNRLDFDKSVQRQVQGDEMETDEYQEFNIYGAIQSGEVSRKDWDDDQPDARSRRRKSKSRATEQESDIESEIAHIANKSNFAYSPDSDAESAGTVRLQPRQAPVQMENNVSAKFSGSE